MTILSNHGDGFSGERERREERLNAFGLSSMEVCCNECLTALETGPILVTETCPLTAACHERAESSRHYFRASGVYIVRCDDEVFRDDF